MKLSSVQRKLSDWERNIINCLLKEPFAGRDQIRKQVESCLVQEIDEDGSLLFSVFTEEKARVEKRVPVEGEAKDGDSVIIHFLLHVVDGKLQELEVYKDDSSQVIQKPKPEKVQVFHIAK